MANFAPIYQDAGELKKLQGGDGVVASAVAPTSGALTLTGAASSVWSTSAGDLKLDSAAVLELGSTNATSIGVGRLGITTTVTGGLSQVGGAVLLTANAASSLTTSTGAITITANASSVWSTNTGNLTISAPGDLTLTGGVLIITNSVLNQPAVSSPIGPALNTLRQYGKSWAGRTMLSILGANTSVAAQEYPLQPMIGMQRVKMWMPLTGTTVTNWGMSSTIVGTASHPALATTNLLTSSFRTRFATSAVAGNFAGLRGTVQSVWRGNSGGFGGFYLVCRFAMTTNLANARAFVGLFASTAALTNVDPSTLLNVVGMSLDSADANWQIIQNDNAGAATKTDLGASFVKSATAVYQLIMFSEPNGSDIRYEVTNLSAGGSASGTLAANLPQNTAFLNPYIWITNNATASIAQIEMMSLYIESDQ